MISYIMFSWAFLSLAVVLVVVGILGFVAFLFRAVDNIKKIMKRGFGNAR